ncbi:RNA polymerase sigma-70 factor (ECF subfamily) [Pedobacter cryoconitis]|uniref:RNA polymerase sigma-70 factor (ECF subfamily) n=1 Tax=Pedobacter cryoconitis TaxID=188932 RepID=A0A7W8YQK2_9SPHI|nr:RNA polymerase sigma-70 factor [Pedobacter cryoconitis]MBB5619983.1 RNA polymerase sigma-70 factor (ECF subfamily) [Pedobacter cryoconitis]MBB5648126.1 RNA polymerase sigma-70 factor (ECF subfamily) [Pedobacter cryoconitis]
MKPDLSPLWTKVCVEDDVKAFEVLYYLLFNKLIKFCIYYVGRKEVAEEIISDILVKCWENRKAETVILNLETYLFTAVRNQSLKYIKKNANVHLVEIEPANEFRLMDNTDPEKQLENKELHHKLDQAIDKLPQQARIIFKLIKENGMKYKEVAEILEISPRTVQTQLFRAIDKLRVSLKAYHHIYTKYKPDDNAVNLTALIFFLHIFHFL